MQRPDTDPEARAAGILLHPTSLPGRFGIGDLGSTADEFLDWAASAGQRIWQVLPLGPTGFGNAPYGSPSAFAGNPLLISPQILAEEGLLPRAALDSAPAFPSGRVDFPSVIAWKGKLLRQCWERFRGDAGASDRAALEAFVSGPEQADWLSGWTRFAAGRKGESRTDEAEFQAYLQFLFFKQWARVKKAANARGISVLGDLPIYVGLDSADVRARPELFDLDAQGAPAFVSGVPPDFFSKTGQLWGNPLYRWDRIEAEGFAWWIARIRANLRTCDLVRIDHFRAFASYWAVPAGETTASNGRWLPGPGRRLFDAVRDALGGSLPIVAEDLGSITDDVRDLLADLGIPGMKVLQFAFSEPDSEYLPHRHVPNCVVYTGTHDNDTARAWYAALEDEARERVRDYLGSDGRQIPWDLIRAAYTSVARRAIVPMQDVLALGSEARMNTPAQPSGNWEWRVEEGGFREEDAVRLKRLAALTGRCE
jgi:4-alpha-glucanotransferase